MAVISSENLADTVILKKGEVVRFNSVIPYYYQLQKYIEQKIDSKEWLHGQRLPSEQALCEYFGVSRSVVRQALSALAQDSYIATYKGKGSFVSTPKMAWQLMQTLRGFYDDAMDKGQAVETKVLELGLIPAESEVAEQLQLQEGDPVVKLHRLRYLDGEPVQVVVSYLPEKLCPGLVQVDFTTTSLYRVLRANYGLVISEGVRTIESVNAPHDIARLLAVKTGAALSLIKSVGFLPNGVPLEHYIAWHRGDRSRFAVKLTAQSV